VSTPLFISVNGTGVPDPWGPGFSGDVGRGLTDPWRDPIARQFWGEHFRNKWIWQPVGYPAAVFPMAPSVTAGVVEVSRLVTLYEQNGICPPGTPLAISGYSQGALVTNTFWRDYVLKDGSPHHNRKDDLAAGGIINFGDPMRCPGIAHGNEVAGFPMPTHLDGVVTGGIAGPGCLKPEETPSFLLSCALDGDLYAAAPVGPPTGEATDTSAPFVNEPLVGQVETRIYNFIESGSLAQGFMAIVKGIAQELGYPLSNTIALFQAISNGLKFASAGVAAPHWQYQGFVPHMVDYLNSRV
jgi:hypothetical protein